MIYKALFTDEFLSYFRLDDNGKTLVLTDKTGLTRAVMLEEVKHGKWVVEAEEYVNGRKTYEYYKCSICGMQLPTPKLRSPFCPLCGADMRERKDEKWKNI